MGGEGKEEGRAAKPLEWGLSQAARMGDREEAVRLLGEGADPNWVDEIGWTALMRATQAEGEGGLATLEALAAVADCSALSATTGDTALMVAIKHGWQAAAKALAKGAAATLADPKGRTPLMMAARMRQPGTVAALLPLSDPLALDAGGWDALTHAAVAGCEASAKILMPVSEWRGRQAMRGRFEGGSAAEAAQRAGHGELANLLREWERVSQERSELAGAASRGALGPKAKRV